MTTRLTFKILSTPRRKWGTDIYFPLGSPEFKTLRTRHVWASPKTAQSFLIIKSEEADAKRAKDAESGRSPFQHTQSSLAKIGPVMSYQHSTPFTVGMKALSLRNRPPAAPKLRPYTMSYQKLGPKKTNQLVGFGYLSLLKEEKRQTPCGQKYMAKTFQPTALLRHEIHDTASFIHIYLSEKQLKHLQAVLPKVQRKILFSPISRAPIPLPPKAERLLKNPLRSPCAGPPPNYPPPGRPPKNESLRKTQHQNRCAGPPPNYPHPDNVPTVVSDISDLLGNQPFHIQ